MVASIFLTEASKARKMMQNTFWDHVKKHKNVGLEKDRENEDKNRSERQHRIYDCLCGNTDELDDYDEFDVQYSFRTSRK